MSRWWTLKHRTLARIVLSALLGILMLSILMVALLAPDNWPGKLVQIDTQMPLLAPIILFATGLLSGASVYTGNIRYNANNLEWFLFWFAIIGTACGWFWVGGRLMSLYFW